MELFFLIVLLLLAFILTNFIQKILFKLSYHSLSCSRPMTQRYANFQHKILKSGEEGRIRFVELEEQTRKLRHSSCFNDSIGVYGKLRKHFEHLKNSKLIRWKKFEWGKTDLHKWNRYFILEQIILLFVVVESNLFGFKEFLEHIVDVFYVFPKLNNIGIVINLLESIQKMLRNITNIFDLRFIKVIIIRHFLPMIDNA